MNIESDLWRTLPHGIVGLVLGWAAVLLGRAGLRLLPGIVMVAACLLTSLLVSAMFAGAWWGAPTGFLLGAALHAAFLSALQSNTSDS